MLLGNSFWEHPLTKIFFNLDSHWNTLFPYFFKRVFFPFILHLRMGLWGLPAYSYSLIELCSWYLYVTLFCASFSGWIKKLSDSRIKPKVWGLCLCYTVSVKKQIALQIFLEAEIIKNYFCDECFLQLACWGVWLRKVFSKISSIYSSFILPLWFSFSCSVFHVKVWSWHHLEKSFCEFTV